MLALHHLLLACLRLSNTVAMLCPVVAGNMASSDLYGQDRVALRDLEQIAVLSLDLSYPAGTQPQRLVFVTSFGTSDPTLVAGLEACCGGPGAVIFLLADGILLLYPFSHGQVNF